MGSVRSSASSLRPRTTARSERPSASSSQPTWTPAKQLLNKYIASDAEPEIEKQLNQWYAESLRYISDQMGADYAAQYRQTTSSGLGINGFPIAKMGVVDAVNSRLRHLNTFIDRLR